MVAENDGKHHETPHQQIRDCLHHTCVVLECITVTAHYLQHKDVMCLDAVSKFTIAFHHFFSWNIRHGPMGAITAKESPSIPTFPSVKSWAPCLGTPWSPWALLGWGLQGTDPNASRDWTEILKHRDSQLIE